MNIKLLCLLTALVLVVRTGEAYAQAQQETPAKEFPPETPAQPQENKGEPTQSPAPAPKPQFFAGTVTHIDPQHITVSRTLVGKRPESRTFLIQASTKISKALRPKLRVTVRYQHLPEGDVALEIQIRHSYSPRTS